MTKGRVLILTGPPGSGKTTVADILAARFERAVHLEADLFFHAIRSGYEEPWTSASHEQNETVMRIVADAALGYAIAAVAILRPRLSVCLERMRARSPESLGDPDVIADLWRGFDGLGDLEHCVIDSGEMDAGATTEQLFERLESGALSMA